MLFPLTSHQQPPAQLKHPISIFTSITAKPTLVKQAPKTENFGLILDFKTFQTKNEQLCCHLHEEQEGSLAQGGLQLTTAPRPRPPKGLHPRRVPPPRVSNDRCACQDDAASRTRKLRARRIRNLKDRLTVFVWGFKGVFLSDCKMPS